jgi:hypothetical protein
VQKDSDVAIVPLLDLLELDFTNASFIGVPIPPMVNCFQSEAQRGSLHFHAGRLALLAMLKAGKDKKMKHCGAWGSMFLRTSTKEQDLIFGMLHLIGLDQEIVVDY